MKTTELTIQQKRQRKALLVLPLVVCCFTTMLFWAFGGGTAETAQAARTKGLNMKLPASILGKEQTGDKMSFYDKAQADSLKKGQLRKTDPNTKIPADSTADRLSFPVDAFSPHQPAAFNTGSSSKVAEATVNEARINQRLSQLKEVVNKPALPETPVVTHPEKDNSGSEFVPVKEDPELKQMNGLLEKILEIQHPGRAQAPAITSVPGAVAEVKKFRAIPAVIEGTQKIVQGTVIKMRLMDSVTLGGQLYQKGQLIYGNGMLASQRYTLNIKSIHVGYNFFPVDLTVFDMTDGLEGISVPEAITGDALRDGAVGGVQNMDMMSFDPSMTAQLTTAGINTAKGLFSKKVKQVKAKLKDGHQLLLRDNKSLKAGNY